MTKQHLDALQLVLQALISINIPKHACLVVLIANNAGISQQFALAVYQPQQHVNIFMFQIVAANQLAQVQHM